MQTIIVSAKNADESNKFIEEYLKNHLKIDYKLSSNNSSPDFNNLDIKEGKKSIAVDDVRSLIKWCNIKPSYSDSKIVLINADGLSIESQNTLLKTIEEPPEYLQIILRTENSRRLLDTVISRCKVYEVGLSSFYSGDSEIEIEILSILNMDLGARIDWANEHKSELTGTEKVSAKFNAWITALRSLMDESEDSRNVERYVNLIAQLSELLYRMKNNNANSFLSMEYFLVLAT